jgi:hypothetical protein
MLGEPFEVIAMLHTDDCVHPPHPPHSDAKDCLDTKTPPVNEAGGCSRLGVLSQRLGG